MGQHYIQQVQVLLRVVQMEGLYRKKDRARELLTKENKTLLGAGAFFGV